MSEPTTDEIARWAALADVHVQRETITGFLPQCRCGSQWPCATGEALSGLLALVAAQAEQIAGLRGNVGGVCIMSANFDASKCLHRGEPEVERLRGELAALHATDDYQRWARAVVERDAAREAVARVRALCQPGGYTTWDADEKLPNPPYKPDDPAVVAWEKAHGHDMRLKCYPEFGCQLLLDPEDVLAALEGGAAT